jgi:hypothetical protein
MDDRRRAREALRAAEIATASRSGRWRAPVYLAAWIVCFVAGAVMMLSSFWVTSQETDDVLFWGGLSLGNVGGMLVVMVYAVRGTARGEL